MKPSIKQFFTYIYVSLKACIAPLKWIKSYNEMWIQWREEEKLMHYRIESYIQVSEMQSKNSHYNH